MEKAKTNNAPLTDGEIRQIIFLMTEEEKNQMARNVLTLLKEGKPFPETTEGRVMAELVRQTEARQPAPNLTPEQIRLLEALPGWNELP